jgi:hypothetical protein
MNNYPSNARFVMNMDHFAKRCPKSPFRSANRRDTRAMATTQKKEEKPQDDPIICKNPLLKRELPPIQNLRKLVATSSIGTIKNPIPTKNQYEILSEVEEEPEQEILPTQQENTGMIGDTRPLQSFNK